MQLTWNSTQHELREQYAIFGENVAKRAHTCYEKALFDCDSWQLLAQQGIWRLPVAEEHGGFGMTWWEFAAALEGLASTAKDLGFLLSMVAHAGCIRALMQYGSQRQKQLFLPKMLAGAVGATAITEPSGGSDVARITTAARYQGHKLIMNGQKTHITNAPVADVCVVVGRIPELGKYDITLFLLECTRSGMEFGEPECMLGNRTSPTGDIFFQDVEVSEEDMLGKPGAGLSILYNMISLDRLLYGLLAAAYTEPIVAQSLAFANERRAFNARIAEHQYVQQKLTDMKIALETSRWLSYAALDKLLRNDPEASLMCSVAKLVGTEGLFLTLQHCIQLYGHTGYMVGDITRMFCDATGTRIAGGTSDIQRKNVFHQMQKLYGYEV